MMFFPPLVLSAATTQAFGALLGALRTLDLLKGAITNCPPGLVPHFVVDRRGRQMAVCAHNATPEPAQRAEDAPQPTGRKPTMLWSLGPSAGPGASAHPAMSTLHPSSTHVLRLNDHKGRAHYMAVGARGAERRPGRGDRGGVYVVSARAQLLSPEGKVTGRERLSNVYDPTLWDQDADLAIAPIHPDSFERGHTPEQAWSYATKKHKELTAEPDARRAGGVVETVRDTNGDTFGWIRRDSQGRYWLDRSEPSYRRRERQDDRAVPRKGGGGHLLPGPEAAQHLLDEANRPRVWQERSRDGTPYATVSTFHYPMGGVHVKHAIVRLHPEAGYGDRFETLKDDPVASTSGPVADVDRWLANYLQRIQSQAFGHEADRAPAAPLEELFARHKTLNDLFASGDLGHLSVERRAPGIQRRILDARKPEFSAGGGALRPLGDDGLDRIWQRYQQEHPRSLAGIRRAIERQVPHLFVGASDRPARAEPRRAGREELRHGYPTIDDAELERIVAEGVKDAAHRFDRRQGVPFSAYAHRHALGHAYRRIQELISSGPNKDQKRLRTLRDDVFGTDTPTKNFLRRRAAFGRVLDQAFPEVPGDPTRTHEHRVARAVLASVWPTGHFTSYRGDEALRRYQHAATVLANQGVHLPPARDALDLLRTARAHQAHIDQGRGSPYAAYHAEHLASPLAEIADLERRQTRADVVATGRKRPAPDEGDLGHDVAEPEIPEADVQEPAIPADEPETEHSTSPDLFHAVPDEQRRILEALYPAGDLDAPRYDAPEVRALGIPRAKLELLYGPSSAVVWDARRRMTKALRAIAGLDRLARALAEERWRARLRRSA